MKLGTRSVLRKLSLRRWASALMSLSVLAAGSTARAAEGPSVWFNPAPQSTDFIDLFTHPELWAAARRRVVALELSPWQLASSDPAHLNSLGRMAQVHAFELLRTWGVKLAIAVDALKEWDCEAIKTPAITAADIQRVETAGGTVDYVVMDEPLISGLGLNKPICNLTPEEVARRVAGYAGRIHDMLPSGQTIGFVDVEAYPAASVEQIEAFLTALAEVPFRLAQFQIDINFDYVLRDPARLERLGPDLRRLQAFLRAQKIPFGVIIWSGHDPVRSDRDYFEHALAAARLVHDSIGAPDMLVFSSWVKRCKTEPGCDVMDVPANLPEADDDRYAHTQLILGVAELFAPAR